MKGFIQQVISNHHLRLVDPVNDKSYAFNDLALYDQVFFSNDKKLIFLYADNSIGAITALFSSFATDHAVALFSSTMEEGLKANLEKEYQPDFIIDKNRIAVEGYHSLHQHNDWNVFKIKDPAALKIHPDLMLLLSTSGTTGSPKLVKLTEKNLLSNANSIIGYLPIVKDDVTPLNLPLYYSYGLSVFTTNCIAGGKLICSNRDIMMKEFWSDFENYKFTSLAGVPFVYEMLNRTGFTKKKFESLRYMTQAGGKLNPALVEVFLNHAEANGYKFYVMYGQTEATARMTYMPFERLREKISSIGIPIPGGTIEINQESGELIYKGSNVFNGYALNRSELADLDGNEVLYTGDIAQMDADGYIYITGRMKRFVKLFGNRINLDEVETFLKQHFHGLSTACIGVADKTLHVFINDLSFDANAVVTLLNQQYKIHPSGIKVQLTNELPLTPNGKPDYTKLTSEYAAG